MVDEEPEEDDENQDEATQPTAAYNQASAAQDDGSGMTCQQSTKTAAGAVDPTKVSAGPNGWKKDVHTMKYEIATMKKQLTELISVATRVIPPSVQEKMPSRVAQSLVAGAA